MMLDLLKFIQSFVLSIKWDSVYVYNNIPFTQLHKLWSVDYFIYTVKDL